MVTRVVPGASVLVVEAILMDWLAEGDGTARIVWLADGDGTAFTIWLAEGDDTTLIVWLAPGPLWAAGLDDVAETGRPGSDFVAASKAANNSFPLWNLSAGLLERPFKMTREIASGTRGCATFSGFGLSSVMLRSTSPRCLPANG